MAKKVTGYIKLQIPAGQAPKAMGLRRHIRRSTPGRSVSFAELVWVHFLRQEELGEQDAEVVPGERVAGIARGLAEELMSREEARGGEVALQSWIEAHFAGATLYLQSG